MTKKFWNDWQNRIGETENISLNYAVYNKNNSQCYYHQVLSKINDDKIIKATFHRDAVDLVIERHNFCNGHYHVENEYLTLHRQEIKCIKFINFWK